jgi:Asp-tRNA(Asn)/Glu-tRNA(Gln) amidotransferase A subunit family amidase
VSAGLAAVAAALRRGETTSVDLTRAALVRARGCQDDVGAFVDITERLALEAAHRADIELAAGRARGPLHGVPVAVKDVVDVAGRPTLQGTAALGHRTPTTDSAAWARLSRQGAALVGKTHTHELAWGMRTPACRNPLDLSRMTGGSSGGSAAAVAAGVVLLAVGTDTGGSVRNPAALCGVSGLKPTLGSVPTAGVSPLAPAQDVVGLLGEAPADCLVGFGVLSEWPVLRPAGMHGLRVGAFADSWATRVDRPVAVALQAAADELADAGVDVVHASVPAARLAPAVSFVVMLAESAAVWWPQVVVQPDGVSDEVRALLRVGASVRAKDYFRALQVGEHLRAAVLKEMDDQGLDALLLATAPVTAALADSEQCRVAGRTEPLASAHSRLTALASVTGLPALSVPCGLGEDGMPIGAQLLGRPGAEGLLCALGEVVDLGVGGQAVAARRADRRRADTPSTAG